MADPKCICGDLKSQHRDGWGTCARSNCFCFRFKHSLTLVRAPMPPWTLLRFRLRRLVADILTAFRRLGKDGLA